MKQDAVLSLAVIGAGGRGNTLTREYIQENPQRVRVTAVAEPDPQRRAAFAKTHNIAADHCFASYQELVARPKLADAAINTTMDLLHYDSAMALLNAGYDMLLEKPIAPTERRVRDIIDTARRLGRTIMICHGMRYAPFYLKVKELIDAGRIGRVMTIAASEFVGYDHYAGAYVRGKWRNTDVAMNMLMAKCCHDLDMIVWLMSGIAPRRVSSFGSLMHFRADQAPPGSAARCLVDCRVEPECSYSVKSLYMRQVRAEREQGNEAKFDDAAVAGTLEELRTGDYGRCVWQTDNNVVDHQMVLMEFEDGALATLNMSANSARATRDIHIIGTRGEIVGDLNAGELRLRLFNPHDMKQRFTEEVFSMPLQKGRSHGGHDYHMVKDFVALMRGEPTSIGRTRVEDSLLGHCVGFAAEEARLTGRVVELPPTLNAPVTSSAPRRSATALR